MIGEKLQREEINPYAENSEERGVVEGRKLGWEGIFGGSQYLNEALWMFGDRRDPKRATFIITATKICRTNPGLQTAMNNPLTRIAFQC